MDKRRSFSVLLILAVFLSGIGLALWAMRPPTPPSGEDVAYKAYSRMLTNIGTMTKEPHPSGSKELSDVRSYLLSQIEEMNLQYQVLSTVCSLDEIVNDNASRQSGNAQKSAPRKGSNGSGKSQAEMIREGIMSEAVFDENGNVTLYNILVKLDAPATERGVLFMAHYDSEFGVPGACDDMTSVCSLLEAMRLQADNPGLKNDLYFLFTDGEELGGMGAKFFVRDNPELADSIDIIVNMEARGTGGGLLMFESSMFDHDQVEHLQAASSHPISYSWLPMAYRQMSNGTDLTRFLNAGYQGLNFAVAEGVENYSSETDDIDHLDRGTAYNYLITAIEFSNYAANTPLNDSGEKEDGVYFTLLSGLLVLMRGLTAQILAGVAVAAALVWLIWQLRLGKTSLTRILSTAGAQLLIIAASAVLSLGAVMLTDAAGFIKKLDDEMLFSIPVFVFIAAMVCAGAFAGFALLVRKRTFTDTLAGILPLLMLTTTVTTVFFNAASYLMTLPLLGLLMAALLEKKTVGKTIAAVVVGIGTLLLYVPLCWLLFITLGLGMMPLIMAFAAIPVIIVAALFKT